MRLFPSRCAVVRAIMFRVLVCSFRYALYTDLLWTGIATEFHMLKCKGPYSVSLRGNLDEYAAKNKKTDRQNLPDTRAQSARSPTRHRFANIT